MKTTHGKRTRNAYKRTQVVCESFYKKKEGKTNEQRRYEADTE